MSKVVTVEELVANIDEHLAEVKRGETFTLTQDGESVASLQPPAEPLNIIRHDPSLRLRDFKPGPPLKGLNGNASEWLIEERERERSGKKYGKCLPISIPR
jgi:antitoxin (DNA-binding transcriptional repressor) of toxin-antitoxin stability system